jgi:hypothetical protein
MAVIRKDGTSRKQDKEDRKQRDENFESAQDNRSERYAANQLARQTRVTNRSNARDTRYTRRSATINERTEKHDKQQQAKTTAQVVDHKKENGEMHKSKRDGFDFVGPYGAAAAFAGALGITLAARHLGKGISNFSVNEGQPLVTSVNYSPSNDLALGDVTLNQTVRQWRDSATTASAGRGSYDVSSYVW